MMEQPFGTSLKVPLAETLHYEVQLSHYNLIVRDNSHFHRKCFSNANSNMRSWLQFQLPGMYWQDSKIFRQELV